MMFACFCMAIGPWMLVLFIVSAMGKVCFYRPVHGHALNPDHKDAARIARAAIVQNPKAFFNTQLGQRLLAKFIELPPKSAKPELNEINELASPKSPYWKDK